MENSQNVLQLIGCPSWYKNFGMTCCFIVTFVSIQCYVIILWLLDMAHIVRVVRASPELPQGQGAHSTWHSGHSENAQCIAWWQTSADPLDWIKEHCGAVCWLEREREREIHRKISGDLKVATFCMLRLTQCIKTSWYYDLNSTWEEGKEKRCSSCS